MQYALEHIASIEFYMFAKNPKRQKSVKRKASGETSGSPSLEPQPLSLSPSSISPMYHDVRGKTVMPSATAIKVKKDMVIKFG